MSAIGQRNGTMISVADRIRDPSEWQLIRDSSTCKLKRGPLEWELAIIVRRMSTTDIFFVFEAFNPATGITSTSQLFSKKINDINLLFVSVIKMGPSKHIPKDKNYLLEGPGFTINKLLNELIKEEIDRLLSYKLVDFKEISVALTLTDSTKGQDHFSGG